MIMKDTTLLAQILEQADAIAARVEFLESPEGSSVEKYLRILKECKHEIFKARLLFAEAGLAWGVDGLRSFMNMEKSEQKKPANVQSMQKHLAAVKEQTALLASGKLGGEEANVQATLKSTADTMLEEIVDLTKRLQLKI